MTSGKTPVHQHRVGENPLITVLDVTSGKPYSNAIIIKKLWQHKIENKQHVKETGYHWLSHAWLLQLSHTQQKSTKFLAINSSFCNFQSGKLQLARLTDGYTITDITLHYYITTVTYGTVCWSHCPLVYFIVLARRHHWSESKDEIITHTLN